MKFLVGVLTGFGVGVAVGLLVSNESAEAVMERLGLQGISLPTGGLGGLGEGLSGGLSGLLGEDMISRASEALAQGMQLYNSTKEELTRQYSTARSGRF